MERGEELRVVCCHVGGFPGVGLMVVEFLGDDFVGFEI